MYLPDIIFTIPSRRLSRRKTGRARRKQEKILWREEEEDVDNDNNLRCWLLSLHTRTGAYVGSL